MKTIWRRLTALLFPPKCVLCGKLLEDRETDLCGQCRRETRSHNTGNIKLPYLAKWTSLWYYEGNVRQSILRYKFHHRRGFASAYGRLLAMKLAGEDWNYDVLTWVPISALRKLRRGYDQVELLARALGQELGTPPQRTLIKYRNNPPQSRQGDAAHRRANVLGVYRCPDGELVRGKRVLLLDDILTTGATAGECARILLTAGAKEVLFASLAASAHNNKKQ